MTIRFVRVLRAKGMKYGLAVDKAGKRWRGFFSNRTETEVSTTADLGSVGLCRVCRSRVYEGWECLNDSKDACDHCVIMPPPNKIFVVNVASENEWQSLVKEFFRNEHFDHKRRNESPHRPGEGSDEHEQRDVRQ